MSQQSFEKHAKFVPLYHYVATPAILVPTIFFTIQLFRNYSLAGLMTVVFGFGVFFAAFFARVFPLGVQDRLIRLEEGMRMERLLPDDLKGRIGEITTKQRIGLRFAPDSELTDLVRKVLDGGLTGQKDIKRAVKSWRDDNERI